mmetsp:Transcript_12342/g.16171  ORF Transcript_12342/g.16171 Transcript_12342/m.16171 type:complete len:80 (-) Transcript_12342:148-387(-)
MSGTNNMSGHTKALAQGNTWFLRDIVVVVVTSLVEELLDAMVEFGLADDDVSLLLLAAGSADEDDDSSSEPDSEVETSL